MASAMMKVTCPLCKEPMELDSSEHDEGDFVRCEECGELLTLEVKKGKFKLVTDQEKKFEEMKGLDDEFDTEGDEE
ncbi:Uncharacterised protein [uncultured archaeon]|nr:Uncharacterised protein [uncultured archaeon]